MSGDEGRLYVYGASGHGRVVAEMAARAGFKVLGFVDDDEGKSGESLAGLPVCCWSIDELTRRAREEDAGVIVGIGDNWIRKLIFERILRGGIRLATVIAPSAVVFDSVKVGAGSFVAAGSVITTDTRIGRNVIVNTAASIDHDCVIGDHAHISPGAHLGGTVAVGEGTHVGIGCAVRNNLTIGSWALLGAGAAVVADIESGVVAYGVPARPVRPTRTREPGYSVSVHANRSSPTVRPLQPVDSCCALLTPSDRTWSDLHVRGRGDPYQLPEYAAVEARRVGGEARALAVVEGDNFLLMPLVVRRVPAELTDGRTILDAVSPYGTPGFLVGCAPSARTEWTMRAMTVGLRHLAKAGVCAVFARLHPLMQESVDVLRTLGEIVDQGSTVWMDLTWDDASYTDHLRENHRRVLKRLERLGARASVCSVGDRLVEFREMYRETMEDVNAADWYFFSEGYFRDLVGSLGDAARLVTVELDGRVVSGSIFLHSNGIVEYYLGATLRAARGLAPSRLVFDFARSYFKHVGAHVLHLGGGLAGAPDSLFNFKAGFSPLRGRFATWRVVTDRPRFDEVCGVWRDRVGAGAVDLRAYFPPYRQQLPGASETIG